jgi:methylisocitrate lyase
VGPNETPGSRLRSAVTLQKPIQVIGTVNAYAALLAERCGFEALYVSGSGVAAASFGLPDLGITSLEDVLIDVRRITDVTSLPVLVDVDTGWGSAFGIARTVRSMARAGAAAVHLEDQVAAKRCGHRPGKMLVSASEMVDRIKAAVDAKPTADFVVMARTDALAVEGLTAALERAGAYVEAGADMLFPEAVEDLETYRKFSRAFGVPVLANITEFGSTPLFTRAELGSADVSLILYPLSAFRAMSRSASTVYEAIRRDGTQEAVVPLMHTREEIYDILDYHKYEQKLNVLFAESGEET